MTRFSRRNAILAGAAFTAIPSLSHTVLTLSASDDTVISNIPVQWGKS